MKKATVLSLLVFISVLVSTPAHAAATTLSLSNSGNGNAAQVRVSGTPNSDATLHFKIGNNNGQPIDLGRTDDAGYLSVSIIPESYGITPGSAVYVIVGSTQSSSVNWPSAPSTVNGTGFSLQVDTVSLTQGGTMVVPVNNLGTGSLTVANNTNTSVAQVSVNGTQLFVTANGNGSDTATVCLSGSTSHCQTLSITVGNGAAQSFSLLNTNPAVAVGKSLSDPINGMVTNTFYISSNSNPNVVQANVSANVVTLTGSRAGTSRITLCKSSSECTTFTATVIDAGSGNAAPALSSTSVSVSVGQSTNVLIVGSGNYFVSNNNNPDVASATISGSSIVVKGLAVGSRIVSLCDTNNQCSTLTIKVSAVTPPRTTTTTPSAPQTAVYQFTASLAPGDQGTAVTVLQEVLKALGFLTATPNGYFGPSTKAAVMAFQAAHGIQTLGSVGPATRAALNALTGSSSSSSTGSTSTTSATGTTGDGYVFTDFLGTGSTGMAVTELQKRLAALGFFSGTPTGYFGSLTAAAVAKFQAAHTITQAGYVGPSTRAALNAS